MTPTPFSSALILGADASARSLDRSVLRLAGIRQAAGLASGLAALEALGNADVAQEYDLILCDETLSDMSALDFLRHMRERTLLGRAPVLVLSRQATQRRVLAAIGAGCSGFLSRPYTVLALETQLARARTVFACGPERMIAHACQVLVNGTDEEDAEFTKQTADLTAASQAAFAEGTEHLLRQRWDAAIEAFNLCLRCEFLEADACMGMAEAWRGKGNIRKSDEYLQRAGSLFVRARRWAEAREAFTRLLNDSPEGTPNPLLLEAAALLRKGDTDTAARALIEACALPNSNELDFRPIARTSQFLDAPEQEIQTLCAAVAVQGSTELSERLRHRLLGRFGEPEDQNSPHLRNAPGTLPRPGFLARTFPLLHDIVSVARFTARCWTNAA